VSGAGRGQFTSCQHNDSDIERSLAIVYNGQQRHSGYPEDTR
jgi:hypothetical protein